MDTRYQQKLYDCRMTSIYQLTLENTYTSRVEWKDTICIFFQRNDHPVCPIYMYCHQSILRVKILCTAGMDLDTF
jgi:hypothetical protein